jgi:hypothetical protein
MSYKNVEIWKLSDELVVEIHEMTLTKIPKFDMFEEGSQIRCSINQLNRPLWKDMEENCISWSL